MIIANKEKKSFIVFSIIQMTFALVFMQLMKINTIGTRNDIYSFLVNLSLYLFIFIVPVMLYIKLIIRANPFTFLKLDYNVISGIFKGVLVGLFIFLFLLFKNKFQPLKHINLRMDIFIILGRVLVGPLEEIPFRGFYMEKLESYMCFWKANIVSATLFMIVHFPSIVNKNIQSFYQLIVILCIGLWMGYFYKKSQSLWCVSIIHSIYDLSLWLIF